MINALRNNYDKIIEQVKQAETIIILNADLVLAEEILSQQGKELIETIKKQTWRIDKLLKKGEIENERRTKANQGALKSNQDRE